MKKRHVLARQFDQFVGRANAAASTAIARFTAVARLRPQWPSWLNQGTMSIVVAGLLCTGCITYLFVSAFQATPGEEPANDGNPVYLYHIFHKTKWRIQVGPNHETNDCWLYITSKADQPTLIAEDQRRTKRKMCWKELDQLNNKWLEVKNMNIKQL